MTKAARSAKAEQPAGAGKRTRAPARANTAPRAPAAAGDAAVQHHEIQNKAMPGASTGTPPGTAAAGPAGSGSRSVSPSASTLIQMRSFMQRATKIVATIGPASSSPEILLQMMQAGLDVVRLNFSHGTADDHRQRAEMVREAARKVGREIAIMADLQGPKIRVGKFENGKTTLA
ncbi:pyruvate kinase, partial [Burkholderia sp. A2]|uniref:pyruvate kinase n=1 Tax=Burkholderia sp. A2 TaxID=236253 RepID=UPI00210E6AF2